MKLKTARNCCRSSACGCGSEPELIACPTCGRIEIDLISMMSEVRRRLKEIPVPVKVAVMGCVVNGPGEAEGSDVAVFAGKHRGVIYVQGEQVATVTEDRDARPPVRRSPQVRRQSPARRSQPRKTKRSTSSRPTRSANWAADGRRSEKKRAVASRRPIDQGTASGYFIDSAMRKLDPRNIEMMDDDMAAVLRTKTGASVFKLLIASLPSHAITSPPGYGKNTRTGRSINYVARLRGGSPMEQFDFRAHLIDVLERLGLEYFITVRSRPSIMASRGLPTTLTFVRAEAFRLTW